MWVDMGMGGFTVPLSELERLSYSEIYRAWERVKEINDSENASYNDIKSKLNK